MPAPASGPVNAIVRERLLSVVREVRTASGYKVVVVDAASVKIVSSACRMVDILEEGVSLVDNLEIRRQPMADMEAIYIISPTETSIQRLKQDFEYPDKPTYLAAHVYFTSHIGNDLIYLLKQSPGLVSRLRALKELHLEFLAPEQQAVSLDMTNAFHMLYSPVSVPKNAMAHTIADRLLSCCITLGERPVVRYQASTTGSSGQAASVAQDACGKIAKLLEQSLTNFERQHGANNAWWGPRRNPPATILIVDRSADPLSPLMHEYSYQAMVHDVVGIKGGKYSYKATNAKGEETDRETALDESDPLWPKLRHLHIADAIAQVLEEFNVFIRENKAAHMAKGEVGDIADMSDAIKAMPQYRELLGKYSLHIDLTKKCMAKYETGGLEAVSTEEQDLALGEDAAGKQVKFPVKGVNAVLEMPTVSEEDKLRLIMIYVITQEGLQESDIDTLIATAKLRDPQLARRTVANLKFLGVQLKAAPEKPTGMMNSAKNMFPFMKSSAAPGKRRAKDVSYDLSRYRPPLQFTIQDLLENKLDQAQFPFATPQAHVDATIISPVNAAKPRAKAGWADKSGHTRKVDAGNGPQGKPRAGPRVIVFVLGGTTYSELRAAYELTKKADREVVIASTEILTPQRFLAGLSALDSAAGLQSLSQGGGDDLL
mmetsp:Transcript_17574/g.42325  ORF Transcript_17574/g.42325 Transcript_17574/m.42325 type:complete len:657 (+) Transcript_17574:41-2011(+)